MTDTTPETNKVPQSPRVALIATLARHRLHLLLQWAIVYQAIGLDDAPDNALVRKQQGQIDVVTRQISDLKQEEEQAVLAARPAQTANATRWEALDATC